MREIHTLMASCPQPFSSTMLSDDVDYLYKPATLRRDNSGELDVFEAARYFSGSPEDALISFQSGIIVSHKATREERHAWGGGDRKSIDVPMIRGGAPPLSSVLQTSHNINKVDQKHIKDKKLKQPISPGGRIANFLNSLFHQTSSSKKKSKSTATGATSSTTQSSVKGEDEGMSPNGRRKRRSIRGRSSESQYSNCSSGSTRLPITPAAPPIPDAPKAYKDLKKSHHPMVSSKCNGRQQPKSVTFCPQSEVLDVDERFRYGGGGDDHHRPWEKNRRASTSGFLEKGISRCHGKGLSEKDVLVCSSSSSSSGFVEKKWVLNKGTVDEKDVVWVDHHQLAPKDDQVMNLWRSEEELVEDGGGRSSESSSDLFELPNYDLAHFSSGLPVYETTSMESMH